MEDHLFDGFIELAAFLCYQGLVLEIAEEEHLIFRDILHSDKKKIEIPWVFLID